MAKINSKTYDATISDLENMAEGIEKYKSNTKINAVISEAHYREMKQALTDARQAYIQAETAARLAYEAFEKEFNKCKNQYATDKRTVKGIMGIRSQELKDFGINPEKAPTGRKTKIKSETK